jgi:hypothetical protein
MYELEQTVFRPITQLIYQISPWALSQKNHLINRNHLMEWLAQTHTYV